MRATGPHHHEQAVRREPAHGRGPRLQRQRGYPRAGCAIRGLAQLESDQKQAQLKLDFEKKIIELTKNHNEELTALKIKLEADYYEKLKAALKTLHEEGNASTKFMQELALNMMKQGPVPTSLQIGMNTETSKGKV